MPETQHDLEMQPVATNVQVTEKTTTQILFSRTNYVLQITDEKLRDARARGSLAETRRALWRKVRAKPNAPDPGPDSMHLEGEELVRAALTYEL